MPLYEYEILDDEGNVVERFEIIQKSDESALEIHPVTGQKVRRIISAPNLASACSTDMGLQRKLNDNKKVGDLGFTKYEKVERGVYEKTAGDGPSIIRR